MKTTVSTKTPTVKYTRLKSNLTPSTLTSRGAKKLHTSSGYFCIPYLKIFLSQKWAQKKLALRQSGLWTRRWPHFIVNPIIVVQLVGTVLGREIYWLVCCWKLEATMMSFTIKILVLSIAQVRTYSYCRYIAGQVYWCGLMYMYMYC